MNKLSALLCGSFFAIAATMPGVSSAQVPPPACGGYGGAACPLGMPAGPAGAAAGPAGYAGATPTYSGALGPVAPAGGGGPAPTAPAAGENGFSWNQRDRDNAPQVCQRGLDGQTRCEFDADRFQQEQTR